jgi:hypothetical protein
MEIFKCLIQAIIQKMQIFKCFMSFCNHGPSILQFSPGNNTKKQIFKCLIQAIIRKMQILNPAKYPSLAKNPPKYTTAYIVQQRNCRWHCEPTFFLGWASTMIIYIHTLPLKSLHLLSLHLQSLPLQTLRLVFFWPV